MLDVHQALTGCRPLCCTDMDFDLIIVGAGPAGLCLARALRNTGLRICLVEKQARSALQQPVFDGREIALTHHSAMLLQHLGIWSHLGDECIAAIKVAAPRAALAGSTSGNTIMGFLPPSSRQQPIRFRPARSPMTRPVPVDPVNMT